jgi:hypothetical protein
LWDSRGKDVLADRGYEGVQRLCKNADTAAHSDRQHRLADGGRPDNGPASINPRQRPRRGWATDVRLQELSPAQAAPILKYYAGRFKVTAPYFDAKPGDPVERFAAEADKHPVFEILPA